MSRFPKPDPLERNGPTRVQGNPRREYLIDLALIVVGGLAVWGGLEAVRFLCRVCFS